MNVTSIEKAKPTSTITPSEKGKNIYQREKERKGEKIKLVGKWTRGFDFLFLLLAFFRPWSSAEFETSSLM